jgi:hypothetical protein
MGIANERRNWKAGRMNEDRWLGFIWGFGSGSALAFGVALGQPQMIGQAIVGLAACYFFGRMRA